jgi:hypothetical protein
MTLCNELHDALRSWDILSEAPDGGEVNGPVAEIAARR